MVENIAAILLFSIPEGIVVTYLASSLQARKIKMAQIVLIGILFGLAVYGIRAITGNYILNICCSTILLIVLLKYLGSIPNFDSLIAGITSISLYLAVEFLNVSFLQTITGVEPTRLQADFSLRLLWFLSQVFIVVVLSLIIRCFLVRKLERKKTDHDCG
ncbi:MAG: hypothetical protein GX207_10485 [Peptococcaceae bacterium]|nr:hypothetical protein [Peptococcaceae bacterium]